MFVETFVFCVTLTNSARKTRVTKEVSLFFNKIYFCLAKHVSTCENTDVSSKANKIKWKITKKVICKLSIFSDICAATVSKMIDYYEILMLIAQMVWNY